MRTSLRLIAFTVSVGLVVTVASCGKSTSQPTQPSPPPTPPTPTPSIVRLEIGGPASVEPGASAQLTLSVTKSDGSVENVTAQTSWFSGNSSVAEVSASGVVTGRARGEATINARYLSRSATRLIMVLPNGTFKLSGSVTDSGWPLEGVTIAVIGGTGEGLTAITPPGGGYALYGVAGNIRIHAKKEGYLNHVEDILVTAHRALNIQMLIDGAPPKLAGTYTLTITAQCSFTGIPLEARNRTYQATVTQSGSQLSVGLSGADFIVTSGKGNRFDGFVGPDKVMFTIGDAYYYYYYYGHFGIVERFAPTALVVNGSVNATIRATGFSGTLGGVIGIARSAAAPFWPFTTACYSQQHGFDMHRQ